MVSLDVRLEHGRDRRSNRGSAVDVLIHEVGVWIDDRELVVRQAAEEVAGARTLVVQERAQDHRNLLVRQADTATGRPACRHSGKPTSSRRAARPRAQKPHGVIGVHAVRPAAVGDHLHSGMKFVQRVGEVVYRHRHRAWHMPRAVLSAWPHVQEHHAAIGQARRQLGNSHVLDLRAIPEIRVSQHLDRRDVLGRNIPHRRPKVHNPVARRAVEDAGTSAAAAHEARIGEDVQVLRGVRDALADL